MTYGNIVQIGQYHYRSDALSRIKLMLETMIRNHSKVLVVRLDIRYPAHYHLPKNKNIINEFYRRLMAHYKYVHIDATYYSAREQNNSDHPHYHCFVLLDGNLRENGWGVRQKAGHIWQTLVGDGGDPCVHLCQTFEGSNGMMLRRPAAEVLADPQNEQVAQFETTKQVAFDWLSYLAKTHTKGNKPLHAKEFSGSRF